MNKTISRKPHGLRRALPAASAIAALVVTLISAPAASADDTDWFVEDPASYVNTLAGTGSGGPVVGDINNFPGPAVPFGMVQFSPSNGHNGAGYRWSDQRLQGFGVNFASQGCGAFGNFPMLPTTINPTSGQPWNRQHNLKRDTQEGEPGYYKVTTTDADNRDIVAELTATDRSGIATFTFPAGQTPTLMFRAGRMNGKDAIKSSLNVNPNNKTVTGWAVNEGFCSATPDNQYRIYYTAKFETDFTHYGAWKEDDATITNKTRTGNGDTDAEFASVHRAGGYVRFAPGTTTVRVKFSTSYVKTGDLALGQQDPNSNHRGGSSLNLATEIPTPDYTDVSINDTYDNYAQAFDAIRADAKARWNEVLGKVKISKTASERDIKTFYHTLYRSFLHPNVISDIDGKYPTFDKFHFRRAGQTTGPAEIMPTIKHIDEANAAHGTDIQAVYANYSDWDTYRSWAPLTSMLAPDEMSDITQTYVLQAEAMGQLPRWSMANASTGQMSGDNASAQIAQSYAFGAQDFNVERALHFMYDGALGENAGKNTGGQNPHSITRPGAGLYNELGYAPQTPEFSTDHAVTGASIAQEWSIDDLAISEFARAIGQDNWPNTVPSNVDQVMRERANTWQAHMNPLNGCLAPRDMSGHFPDVTDCQDTPRGFGYWASNTGGFQTGGVTGYGQVGFDEATSEQYLWMVPQNLKGLGQVLGGREAAADRLDSFMEGGYNVGANVPKMWAGNEPNFATPWAFNYYGKPWRTQKVVDDIRNDLFGYSPDAAEPGNDDLGAMSAWYVWAALGIYPATPGTTIMTVNTPNFDKAVVELGNGNTLTINAPGATSQRYIAGLSVNGTAQTATYLPDGWLDQDTTLDFTLSANPTNWGTAESDAPPSFDDGSQAVIAYAHPIKVAPGSSATRDLGVQRVTSTASSFTLDASAVPAGFNASLTNAGTFNLQGKGVASLRVVAGSGVVDGDYTLPLTVVTDNDERQALNVTVRVARAGGFLDATTIQAHSADNSRDVDFEPVSNSSRGFIRDELASAGFPIGQVHDLQAVSGSSALAGLNVYIPDTAEGLTDSIVPAGQTVTLPNSPTKISFLGAARNGNTSGTAQVTLDNGTNVNVDLSLGDWVLPESGSGSTWEARRNAGELNPMSGNITVAWTAVRVGQSGDPGAYVFATTPYTAPAGRTITSVTLPGAGAADEKRRVFAIAQDTEIPTENEVAPAPSVPAGPVQPGDTVAVSGSGFTANESVKVYIDGEEVGSGTADGSGNVTITVTVPADLESGSHSIVLIGETTGASQPGSLVVEATTYTPVITAPTSLRVGSQVDVAGSGFAPSEPVTVALGTASVSVTATPAGAITASLPGLTTAGTATITATGALSEAVATRQITFTALPATPTLALSVSSGRVIYGLPVTLRAQASTGVSGQVEFFAGSRSLGRAPIVGSVAQLRVSDLSRGSYAVRAQLVGTSTLSPTVNLTVTKAKAKSVKLRKAKKYQRGKAKTIRVRVGKLNNGQRAAGRVVVRVGKKKVRTVKIGANKKKVKVKIPKKFTKKKRIKVRANFRPNDRANIKVTKSKVITMKAR